MSTEVNIANLAATTTLSADDLVAWGVKQLDGGYLFRKMTFPDLQAAIGGGATWGAITGTLSNQTDLASALTGKVSTSVVVITSGKTLSVSNTLILAGTEGSTLNIGTGGTLGTNAFTSTAYVPQTITVNGHALSSNVTVTKSDVGLGNVLNIAFDPAAVAITGGTINGTVIGGSNPLAGTFTGVQVNGDIITNGFLAGIAGNGSAISFTGSSEITLYKQGGGPPSLTWNGGTSLIGALNTLAQRNGTADQLFIIGGASSGAGVLQLQNGASIATPTGGASFGAIAGFTSVKNADGSGGGILSSDSLFRFTCDVTSIGNGKFHPDNAAIGSTSFITLSHLDANSYEVPISIIGGILLFTGAETYGVFRVTGNDGAGNLTVSILSGSSSWQDGSIYDIHAYPIFGPVLLTVDSGWTAGAAAGSKNGLGSYGGGGALAGLDAAADAALVAVVAWAQATQVMLAAQKIPNI